MKKNYSLFLFLFAMMFAMNTNAQSPRVALIEEATQASCPPCATLNPALQDMVNANEGNVVFLGYQVWWPGFDPMYEDNPAEVDERVGNYYDFAFAPQIKMQGSFVTGSGDPGSLGNLMQSQIDAVNADTSEFEMTLTAAIENGQLKIGGSVDAFMDVPMNGDLRLRIAIIEHVIYATDAPGGTNGETEYHNVFKKFVGGTEGIDIADMWTAGDSYTVDETFDLGTLTIYDYAQVEVIAFVQNDGDKFVHQATHATDVNITVDFDNNAAATAVGGLPAVVCSGSQMIEPVFTLQNTGNDNLTSATILYNVNGGANETYSWSGDITTLAKENITLPAISFDAVATNIVNVEVIMPNGMADESMDDNMVASQEISLAPSSEEFVVVDITTDAFGDETYWEIRDGGGDIVKWGGNPNVGLTNIGTGTFPPPADPAMYANATNYLDTVIVTSLDCFTFHITDYFGDGLSLPYTGPTAYYRVIDNMGNVMIDSGNNPNFVERTSDYETTAVNSTNDLTAVEGLNFFPNPASTEVTVVFEATEILEDAVIEVTNLIGQRVVSQPLGQLNTGNQQIVLNVADFANGLYNVTISDSNKIISKKLQVQH